MILRIAFRSLTTRPLRSAVLAAGFGLGIGVMVELLGVGQVILEQAHSPALRGGGDVVVSSDFGPLLGARFLLKDVIGSTRFRDRVRAASPSKRATLYVIGRDQPIPVSVQGGVPSLERAIGDEEIGDRPAWTDLAADASWTRPPPEEILRALDRFHARPAGAVSGFNELSWAEWLYFNGRSRDGRLRFYLSFIAGAANGDGMRPVNARLQLDRDARSTSYAASALVNDADLLARAPDLDVAGNVVRLGGSQYRISLALTEDGQASSPRATGPGRRHATRGRLTGAITLDASPGRSLPPAEIHGAGGWLTGYVVPALDGTFHGTLLVDGQTISVDGLAGYHDHNWGYWDGVHWQWGQVSNGDLSIVYGRVFPPASVADPDRVPGFLGVLGPDGPVAFSTNLSIEEHDQGDRPRTIDVRARGQQLDMALRFTVAESERTSTFVQLGGVYDVSGRVRDRDLSFTSRGSAETFRP